MDQDRRHRIRLCLAIGLFGLLMPAACTGAPQPKGEAVDITLRDFHINTGTPSVTSGDVVWAAPGEEHWHGACGDSLLTHMAVSHGTTEWGGEVGESDYTAAQP